jgi:hypothetical protein
MPARLAVTAALILAAAASAADPPANPEYASWAGYRPGAMVTHRLTFKLGGRVGEQIVRTVLREVADDRLTLAVTESTTAGGKETVHGRFERAVPKLLAADTPAGRAVLGGLDLPPGKVAAVGDEVEVGGRKYKCERVTLTPDPGTTVTRPVVFWFADGVPGRVVRSAGPDFDFGHPSTRMDGVKLELVEVKADRK